MSKEDLTTDKACALLKKTLSSLDYTLRFSQFHYYKEGKYKEQYEGCCQRLKEGWDWVLEYEKTRRRQNEL